MVHASLTVTEMAPEGQCQDHPSKTNGRHEVHLMPVVFPLQLEKDPKALRFEVGSRWSLPLR